MMAENRISDYDIVLFLLENKDLLALKLALNKSQNKNELYWQIVRFIVGNSNFGNSDVESIVCLINDELFRKFPCLTQLLCMALTKDSGNVTYH